MKKIHSLQKHILVLVAVLGLLVTFYGCSTGHDGDTIIKKEETIIYTSGKTKGNGTLYFSSENSTAIIEAKEPGTLPADSEIFIEERDLYSDEVGIYGNNASKVYTLTGIENVNGSVRLITEVRKPITVTIANNFPEKYTDFYLGFKNSKDSDWTYINLKDDGTAVVASARMATTAPKEFVISTYRLDYSFTVFAYDPKETITPDSIKDISFQVVPADYKYAENDKREKYYTEDITIKTVIEAAYSSSVFSGSLVSTEITFFTPSSKPLSIKINGKDAKDTVSSVKQSDGNYIHKIVFDNYSADSIESSGNLATFKLTLNTKGVMLSDFPTDFRLKTVLADVKANKFASEYKITRELAKEQEPVAMAYDIVVPAKNENVATSTVIDIAFKEEIKWSDEPSKHILLKGEKLAVIPLNYAISEDSRHLVVTPLRSLRYEDKYKLTIGECIAPKKSDNFFKALTYEFTTMSGKAASASIFISEDYIKDGLYSFQPVFTVNFQKPVASQNLARSAIAVTSDGIQVPFSLNFASGNSSVASLTFQSMLQSGKTYTIAMTGTVEDGEGYNIAPFAPVSFTTLSDNSVVYTEPEADSVNIDVNTDISIVFDFDIAWEDSFAEFIELTDSRNNKVECDFSYSSNNKCLKLHPKESLYYSEKYKVTIKSGLENKYTRQIVFPTSFSFATVESEYQRAAITADEGTVYDDTASPKFVFVQNNGFVIDFIKTPKSLDEASASVVITCDNVAQNWNKTWIDDKKMKIVPTDKLNFSRIYNIRMSDSLRAVDNSLINQFVPLNVQCFYYEGKGTDDEPFEVTNAEQFDRIRNFLSDSFILKNDIDFDGYETPFYFDYAECGFKPIGTEGAPFSGTLFGNGKRLINLQINREVSFLIGIFGTVKNALIKDLIVDSTCEIKGGFAIGSIAGSVIDSEVSNCINYGNVWAYYPGSTTGIGGIASVVNNSSLIKCVNKHDLALICVTDITGSGGIAAYVTNNSLIKECVNEGKLSWDKEYSSEFGYGGNGCNYAGIACWVASSTVSYCENKGLVEFGRAGIAAEVRENSLIEHCDNYNSIYTQIWNSGGIAGNVNHSAIKNCSNTGYVGPEPVSGDSSCPNVGGIAGSINDESTISDCTNSGNITGSSYVGGIAGCRNGWTIENCTNSGNITGYSNYGDISGDN